MRALSPEIVPEQTHFEFTHGEPVVVPVRVVFLHDLAAAQARWKRSKAEGNDHPMPTPPSRKFAVQPDGADFWGIRVETPDTQFERPSFALQSSGSRKRKPIPYQIVKLSPSAPYARAIDLGRLGDFSEPGEYRVQLLYNSGGNPDRKKGEWDGGFTSPVFTVVVRE